MHTTSFACPHCSATLRIRDQSYLGRTVNCPDCGKPFEIVAPDGHAPDTITAEKVTADKDQASQSTKKQTFRHIEDLDTDTLTDSKLQDRSLSDPTEKASRYSPAELQALEESAATKPSAKLPSWLTPSRLGWLVAGTTAVVLITAISLTPSNSEGRDTEVGDVANETFPEESPEAKPIPEEAIADTKPAEEPPAVEEPGNVDGQLTQLGKHILDFTQFTGTFPWAEASDLPAEKQLSWMAQLATHLRPKSRIEPLWDRPWNDPLNDRFVRQKFTEFHNPSVAGIVSDTGYPAAHYVGVAGVGEDAATLPTGHPRAGVFGYGRKLQPKEISDGASNTMMIAGVNRRLGSWAAGGDATIRSFNKEPYINGPDGFGTGQDDGMYVLMADGSVRFVSKKVDPLVVRRMAAAADGFPLDKSVPGEPGDQPPSAELKTVVAQADPPGDDNDPNPVLPKVDPSKLEPVEPAPEDLVDVDAQLEQPIQEFLQAKPTSLRVMLLQIEEMAGIPIQYEEEKLGEEVLDSELTLSLKNTTVGAILAATLDKVGLKHVIDSGKLQIVKKPAAE